MNSSSYKKNLVNIKYKERENYSLKREPDSYNNYYKITLNAKYGQSKFLISSDDAKAIIIGSNVEGQGLFEKTFVKNIENNYLYLSRGILSYGSVTIIFKCKLNTLDRWLDWNKDTWREKIEYSQRTFHFNTYNSQDSYFLRVKNFYESRCLFPASSYIIRVEQPPEIFNLYCGQSLVNTYNVENITCGEDARYMGGATCVDSHNNTYNLESVTCGEDARYMGRVTCRDLHNNSYNLEDVTCGEDARYMGDSVCRSLYNNSYNTLDVTCGEDSRYMDESTCAELNDNV